jgi:hypothetical protein
MSYTYEDIAAKAEWEGGLDEALDWFDAEEVPKEIRGAWQDAKDLKSRLDSQLDYIWTFIPEELQ